jgi:hypothetical protein
VTSTEDLSIYSVLVKVVKKKKMVSKAGKLVADIKELEI